MNSRITTFLLIAAAAIATGPVVCAGESPEDSKLSTEDASPADAGVLEVTLGIDAGRATKAWDGAGARSDRGGRASESTLVLDGTYGLGHDIDIGLTIGYSRLTDGAAADGEPDAGHGLNDLELSSKWRCWQSADEDVGFAVVPSLSIPGGKDTPDDQLPVASRLWTVGLTAACTLVQRDVFTENLALGAGLPLGGSTGDDRATLEASAAFGWQVSELIQPEVELGWERTLVRDGDSTRLLTGTIGLWILPNDTTRFAIGVSRDLAGRNEDQSTTLHLQAVAEF